jgi:hypothetical protein
VKKSIYEQVFGRVLVDYHLAGRSMADLQRAALPEKRAVLCEIEE